MIKKIIANIYLQGSQEDAAEFQAIIKSLEDQGYEIAWQNYPTNAAIIKEVQNEVE